MRHVITRFEVLSYALIIAAWLAVVQSTFAHATPAPTESREGSFQDSTSELSLEVGNAVLVECARPMKRVAVAKGDVAEATAISPIEIMVNGKAPGHTSLIIWDDRGGHEFFSVTVHDSAAALVAVKHEPASELPGQPVRLTAENGLIYPHGTVKDLTSSARAVQIASAAGKVMNLLDVEVPQRKPEILLKVRFASVDRNKAKDMGISFFDLGLGKVVGGVSTGQLSTVTVSGTGSSSSSGFSGTGGTATLSDEGNFTAYFPGLNAGASIKALETTGLAEVLAEPNIISMDGKEASFLAGGEYPYPVVQPASGGGVGAVSIEFKDYGVRLNFIPTLTPSGTIRLQVAPEVSALDFADALEISGFTIPAITLRKMNTEVELGDGETVVLGGLLDNRETESFEKIPFIGDVPILGKFFQSKSTNRTNTELMVLVTPEIVVSVLSGTQLPALKYPAKFLPSNSNTPMNTPDAKTAANTPVLTAIPVETLIQSMKPEKPLVIEGGTGRFGAGSTSTNAGGASSPDASPQQ